MVEARRPDHKPSVLFEPEEVTFEIHYETKHGENLYITGEGEAFGKWDPYRLKMKWTEVGLMLLTTRDIFGQSRLEFLSLTSNTSTFL